MFGPDDSPMFPEFFLIGPFVLSFGRDDRTRFTVTARQRVFGGKPKPPEVVVSGRIERTPGGMLCLFDKAPPTGLTADDVLARYEGLERAMAAVPYLSDGEIAELIASRGLSVVQERFWSHLRNPAHWLSKAKVSAVWVVTFLDGVERRAAQGAQDPEVFAESITDAGIAQTAARRMAATSNTVQ